MVRSIIIVSALFALIASVSAVPRPASLVDLKTKKYIGVGQVNAQGAATKVVNANNLEVQDAAQNVDVLSDNGHGHGGLLGGLLKREEATVRIAKKVGMKGKKMNAKRMGAKKPAQKK